MIVWPVLKKVQLLNIHALSNRSLQHHLLRTGLSNTFFLFHSNIRVIFNAQLLRYYNFEIINVWFNEQMKQACIFTKV